MPHALEEATNQQMFEEILRRSDSEASTLFGVDEHTIGLAVDATVFDLPVTYVDPLGNDDIDDDGLPLDAVADSNPEEGDGDPAAYEL